MHDLVDLVCRDTWSNMGCSDVENLSRELVGRRGVNSKSNAMGSVHVLDKRCASFPAPPSSELEEVDLQVFVLTWVFLVDSQILSLAVVG